MIDYIEISDRLTPDEIEALQRDKKKSDAYLQKLFSNALVRKTDRRFYQERPAPAPRSGHSKT